MPDCCNTNIFMTGTCTLAIVRNFENLFGVKINCTHWPRYNDMRHRSVGIKLKYTSAPMNDIKKVINATMKGRSASQSRKIIIYSNMRDKIVHLGKKVGDYLEIDEATYLIDSKHVYYAVRAEFPPSIQDMCQEKGRVGRIPSATPDVFTYLVCFDVESFVLLLRRTLNPERFAVHLYLLALLNPNHPTVYNLERYRFEYELCYRETRVLDLIRRRFEGPSKGSIETRYN